MEHHYFTEPLLRDLVSKLITELASDIEARIQRCLFLMIFYLILLMLAYVIVWVPLISSLTDEISKAKLMLMIVPIEILVKMKSIAKVLNSSELL